MHHMIGGKEKSNINILPSNLSGIVKGMARFIAKEEGLEEPGVPSRRISRKKLLENTVRVAQTLTGNSKVKYEILAKRYDEAYRKVDFSNNFMYMDRPNAGDDLYHILVGSPIYIAFA